VSEIHSIQTLFHKQPARYSWQLCSSEDCAWCCKSSWRRSPSWDRPSKGVVYIYKRCAINTWICADKTKIKRTLGRRIVVVYVEYYRYDKREQRDSKQFYIPLTIWTPYTNLSTARMVMAYQPNELDVYCYQQEKCILVDKMNLNAVNKQILHHHLPK
jgi:hypothetical protein